MNFNPETGESLNFNESNIINAIGNWGASLENWAMYDMIKINMLILTSFLQIVS